MMKFSPGLSRVLKLTVSLGLVVLVVWQVGPRAVIPDQMEWRFLLAAVAVFFVSNVLGAYQVTALTEEQRKRRPLRRPCSRPFGGRKKLKLKKGIGP